MSMDDFKSFTRTKQPRMHVINQMGNLFGLIHIPMQQENIHLVLNAYKMVSPKFIPELKGILDEQGTSVLVLFLQSLVMQHPSQRVGPSKLWDLGYSLVVSEDVGLTHDGTTVHGITVIYPLQSEAKEVLSFVRSLIIFNHDAPPVQFYSMPKNAGSNTPCVFSVSRNSVSVFDAESEMLGLERMNHEAELHCYMTKLLFQPVGGDKYPHVMLHKEKVFIPPHIAVRNEMAIQYKTAVFSSESNAYVFPDGTKLLIVNTQRISGFEYEMLKKKLG